MTPDSDSAKTDQRLASLSHSYLSDLARAATRNPTIDVIASAHEQVHGGFGGAIGGTALYRFSLRTTNGQKRSLFLKILYRRPGEDERSPYYWKREYELYRSGLLADLPPDSFSLPRMYGFEDFGDACWIWMEDIVDNKRDWTLADYEDIALRLGRFNGAWLNSDALPDKPWLSRNWHSAIVPALSDTFDNLDHLLAPPLVRTTLPMEAKAEIKLIWRDRDVFCNALSELPQAFCHIDAFNRNVLYRKDDVVLLDWALAGPGAIGEDLVSLVAVSLYYAGFTHADAVQLDRTVFEGYIKGLRLAGWTGDARLARIGYTCAMTLRGLAGVKQDIGFLTDNAQHDRLRALHNSDSLREIAEFFADIRRFRLLKMAREARRLLSD